MEQTQTNTKPAPTMRRYKIRDTFNMPEASPAAEIPGLEPGLLGVPPVDEHYVFETDRLRQFTMFWVGGFRALMVEGDPAAGKTSFVEQIHAGLNVPLQGYLRDGAELHGVWDEGTATVRNGALTGLMVPARTGNVLA